MIKILHSADWHMDAPLRGFSPQQRQTLRQQMLRLPGMIADLCIREGCDLVLLAGDVFDGDYTREGYEAVYRALARMGVPVFISPGNHDPYRENSPWVREPWPENVRIFTKPELQSFRIPQLQCRVYGAAFTGMDCPGLLAGFQARCDEPHALLVVHGDPTAAASPYNPITPAQIRDAGVDYAALGHIHAGGQFAAGAAVCAWPGCPMGHGFDETGPKGVLIAEISDAVRLRFAPLDVPRFYEERIDVGSDPAAAIAAALPKERDFCRLRLVGETNADMAQILRQFANYPNLTLLDETVAAVDLWENAGSDSFEGVFFRILRDAARAETGENRQTLELAAKIARRILQGREVELP